MEPLCSICDRPYAGFGHNPQPVKPDVEARCCSICNDLYVIPARIRDLSRLLSNA